MKKKVTTGQICLDDEYGFTYYIAKIEYCEREDESYSYTFIPNYSVIDLLTPDLYQGIPGLDMSKQKAQYKRNNVTPVFISERTPGKNRENLWELLDDCNMEYLNRLEWLIRTDYRYSGDPLYVIPYKKRTDLIVDDISVLDHRSGGIINKVLGVLCRGGYVKTKDYMIDNNNRKAFYSLLKSIYVTEKSYIAHRKANGIKKAAEQGKYRGREKIRIDDTKLLEVISDYENHKITGEQAADKLNISRSTFLRRYRIMKD